MGQNVAFDHGDRPKVVGKHTGGEEARHAGTEDNGPVTTFRHLIPLLAKRIGAHDRVLALCWRPLKQLSASTGPPS
jgi:hypothetical protein